MEQKYLIKDRLGDVITLIQILALNPDFSYRTTEKLEESIGKPTSKNTWSEVAKDHAEFFRVSKSNMIILLTRFASDPKSENPNPLKLDELKILLDNAIQLYGKELDRQGNDLQRRSINSVLGVAIVSVIVSGLSVYNTILTEDKYDKIENHLNRIENQINLTLLKDQNTNANLDSTLIKK